MHIVAGFSCLSLTIQLSLTDLILIQADTCDIVAGYSCLCLTIQLSLTLYRQTHVTLQQDLVTCLPTSISQLFKCNRCAVVAHLGIWFHVQFFLLLTDTSITWATMYVDLLGKIIVSIQVGDMCILCHFVGQWNQLQVNVCQINMSLLQ